jgi:hypothetical protein
MNLHSYKLSQPISSDVPVSKVYILIIRWSVELVNDMVVSSIIRFGLSFVKTDPLLKQLFVK